MGNLACTGWWLNISLWDALIMDIGLVLFYLVYAYIYNIAYDKLFPIEHGETSVQH